MKRITFSLLLLVMAPGSLLSQDYTVPANSNLILDGSNRWIFHTPDNGSTIAYFAPWLGSDWGWDRFQFSYSGLQIGGNLAVGGNLRTGGDMQITSAALPMGFARESGGTTPILNMSLNFRGENLNQPYRGGGFRIDSRDNFPLFQWLSRAPGQVPGAGDKLVMDLNQNGGLTVRSLLNPGATVIHGGLIGSLNSGHELNLVGGVPVDAANPSVQTSGGHIRLGGNGRGDNGVNVIQFLQNGTERMRINNGGNVGIGTTDPQSLLDLYSNTPLGVTAGSSKLMTRFGSSTAANNIFSSQWIVRGVAGGSWNTAVIHDGISVDASFLTPRVDTRTWWERNAFDDIQSWGTAASTYMVLKTGNVGIGTTNPNQKLTVNGTIYGKEVKVDLNVPGPDYVFEKDYKLASLDEIKSYIDKHKHLPEVPSAKEMEKNGVQLGEMNMLLLKKVEELTLYMIELKAENQSLKTDNAIIKSRIEKLENK
ncbi:MAG: hypothetical protein K2U26_14480 [Cyclobacteriaceae bacterium]|nr:hypothetical protein [Cyclobacteriaceae bacterium]